MGLQYSRIPLRFPAGSCTARIRGVLQTILLAGQSEGAGKEEVGTAVELEGLFVMRARVAHLPKSVLSVGPWSDAP